MPQNVVQEVKRFSKVFVKYEVLRVEELSLQDIKEIELSLLEQFHSICQDQGFRYSLTGGSLIGAVRHQGFIPWDDDIDVFMPRPDYDRFIKYCYRRELPFRLITYETVKGYNGLSAKLSDLSTIILDDVVAENYEMGVNIDLFPIEGLGNSKKEALKLYNKTVWQRELVVAAAWKKYFRSKTHSLFIEPIRLIMFFFSRFVDPKKLLRGIDAENRSYSFDDCLYAGDIAGNYRKKEIMEKRVFETFIDVEFEGRMFKAIENYHEFLTNIYGDYMILPPEEKRMTHHTFKAYSKNARGTIHE